MSVQAITWALGKAPNLASQAVLFALANYADEWGITFVGQDTVATDCACRRPTVTANMAKLEDDGLIARVRRHDAGGRRTSDIVVLAPNAPNRGSLLDADKRAGSVFSADVCALARQGTTGEPRLDRQGSSDESLGTPDESLGTPGVHEPSEEPSGEPSEVQTRARAIDTVWSHYQTAIPNGSRYKLDHARRLLVGKALKVRTAEECCRAIDGLAASEYHVGNGYLDIKYALLGGGRNPSFEATIDRLGAQANGTAGRSGKVTRGNTSGREIPDYDAGMIRNGPTP